MRHPFTQAARRTRAEQGHCGARQSHLRRRDQSHTAPRRHACPPLFLASEACNNLTNPIHASQHCPVLFGAYYQTRSARYAAAGSSFPPSDCPRQCAGRRGRSACSSPSRIPSRSAHPQVPRSQFRPNRRGRQSRHDRPRRRPSPSRSRAMRPRRKKGEGRNRTDA